MTAAYRSFEIYIDLEVDDYRLVASFLDEGTDIEHPPISERRPIDALDLVEMKGLLLSANYPAYGDELAKFLFAEHGRAAGDRSIADAFRDAERLLVKPGDLLHFRLRIDNDVRELQALDWERLNHPENPGTPLSTEQVLFSRRVSTRDWRRRDRHPPRDPRAMLAIIEPSNLEQVRDPKTGRALASLGDGTLARAEGELHGWRIEEMKGPGTRANLIEAISSGADLLYLVCHGVRNRSDGVNLVLQKDDGTVEMVAAKDIVQRLEGVSRLPRVCVLAMCHSAEEDVEPLAALGPQLCEAGVPAVVAMQGPFSIESANAFFPTLFAGLRDHGQLDLALAHARAELGDADRRDWSVPTLFTRLRRGRIWSKSLPSTDFRKWPSLVAALEEKEVVPVIGFGASNWLVGSQAELAQRLALEHDFPLSRFLISDITQVAQYVKVRADERVLRRSLRRHLLDGLVERRKDSSTVASDASLSERISAAARSEWDSNDAEVHAVLAKQKLPLYITTEPIDLMGQALREVAGVEPITAYYQWRARDPQTRKKINWPQDDIDALLRANPDRPIVYHLYGSVGIPGSIVTTEDDFFEFLYGFRSGQTRPILDRVKGALTQADLMFLGFGVDDWDLRVLLRAAQGYAGHRRIQQDPHREEDDDAVERLSRWNLSVQLDPDEDRAISPTEARKYLETMFQKSDIEIYWANLEAFVKELKRQLDGS